MRKEMADSGGGKGRNEKRGRKGKEGFNLAQAPERDSSVEKLL